MSSEMATLRTSWTIPKSALGFHNVMLFLLPALTAVRVNFVGQLMASDFLVVVLLVILLMRGIVDFRQPYIRGILIFYSLWVVGMLASDLWNVSPLVNLMKGWAMVGLFGIYLVVIFTLADGRRDRLFAAMIGYAIAGILNAFGGSARGSFFDIQWKFGAGNAMTIFFLLLVILAGFGRRQTGFSLMLMAPVHLFLDARSLFLRTFLAGALCTFSQRVTRARNRAIAAFLFLALLIGGMTLGETIYDQVIRTGIFGQEMLEKHLRQTEAGNNILLGGRPESIISLRAIKDSPILGHGSWAEDRQYRYLYYQLLEAQGTDVNWKADYLTRIDTIPSHSVLLGTWVEHGVFAGLFWAFILYLALRALIAGMLSQSPATSIEFLAIVTLLWDIPFSPFGADRRCTMAILIAIAAAVVAGQSKRYSQNGAST
ncbi:MAG: hypothetical protein CL814_11715 [Confluentimicrobium sp.]|uniref:O-antigen ligase family protein n=1 Tax=Actibacterium sp. TaxID=1872125 RepID=UPI000C5185C6|nr:O-antigen ligase family protein [Actibacterium sp.]MBC57583.1 hypothetical protein [Actibacterium sp.]|tara:strand:+ start:9044 stop:10327 length:1284 start_codon:yes stop_codon:yes gene_type:complete